MKAFIDRVFKKRKQDAEQIRAEDKATEAMVKAIIEEVKQEMKKEEVVIHSNPNHFSDCTCFKCIRWRNQNAK